MELSSAFLILLACSPDSSNCREMRYTQTYASVEECRELMPDTLRQLNRIGQPAIGRCVSSEPGIDPMTTASVEKVPPAGGGEVIVNVTRFENGRPVVTIYNVPKAAADSD